MEREGHQISVSALLFLGAVLHLARRWRKGDTKAIKATVQKFFLFIILTWWTVLWRSVEELIGCIITSILLWQCMLKQSTWFYIVTENRVSLPFPPFLASHCSSQQSASRHKPAIRWISSRVRAEQCWYSCWPYWVTLSEEGMLETWLQDASSKLIEGCVIAWFWTVAVWATQVLDAPNLNEVVSQTRTEAFGFKTDIYTLYCYCRVCLEPCRYDILF